MRSRLRSRFPLQSSLRGQQLLLLLVLLMLLPRLQVFIFFGSYGVCTLRSKQPTFVRRKCGLHILWLGCVGVWNVLDGARVLW